MFTFLEFLFGFLIARLVWNAIVHLAAKKGELPLVWAFKTCLLLSALFGIVGLFVVAILYVVAR